jgi:hypothetical protein
MEKLLSKKEAETPIRSPHTMVNSRQKLVIVLAISPADGAA